MTRAFLILVLVATPVAAQDTRRDTGAPILRLTPGTILTRRRAIICTPGYAAAVRSVSQKRRDSVYTRYHVPLTARKGYVLDHSIPLEIGGSNRISNLFPQDTTAARQKDRAEGWAKREACTDRQTVRSLQLAIAKDWHAVRQRVPASFVGPISHDRPCRRGYTLYGVVPSIAVAASTVRWWRSSAARSSSGSAWTVRNAPGSATSCAGAPTS